MEPTYSVADSVWYCGERAGTIVNVTDKHNNEGYYYDVAVEDSDENLVAHANELEPRQTRLRETVHDKFGGLEVRAKGNEGKLGSDGHINYSIPAQGAGDELSPEEARLVADAFREGEEGLMLIIDDDPHEVADAFEEAADMVEEFKEE